MEILWLNTIYRYLYRTQLVAVKPIVSLLELHRVDCPPAVSHREYPVWTDDLPRRRNPALRPSVVRRGAPMWYPGLWLHIWGSKTCTWNATSCISDLLLATLSKVCRGTRCFLICASPINACPKLRQRCVIRSVSRGGNSGRRELNERPE